MSGEKKAAASDFVAELVQREDDARVLRVEADRAIEDAVAEFAGMIPIGLVKHLEDAAGLWLRGVIGSYRAQLSVLQSQLAEKDRRIEELTGFAQGWHSAVETILTVAGLSSALGATEAAVAMRDLLSAKDRRCSSLEEALREAWEIVHGLAINGKWLKTEEPFQGALNRLIKFAKATDRRARSVLQGER